MPDDPFFSTVTPSDDDERTIAIALSKRFMVSLLDRVYWIHDPAAVHEVMKKGLPRLVIGPAELRALSREQRRRVLTRRRIRRRRELVDRVMRWIVTPAHLWLVDPVRPLVEYVAMPFPPANIIRRREPALEDLSNGWRGYAIEPGRAVRVEFDRARILLVEIGSPDETNVAISSVRSGPVEFIEGKVPLQALREDVAYTGGGVVRVIDRHTLGSGVDLLSIGFEARSERLAFVNVRAWGIDVDRPMREVEAIDAP